MGRVGGGGGEGDGQGAVSKSKRPGGGGPVASRCTELPSSPALIRAPGARIPCRRRRRRCRRVESPAGSPPPPSRLEGSLLPPPTGACGLQCTSPSRAPQNEPSSPPSCSPSAGSSSSLDLQVLAQKDKKGASPVKKGKRKKKIAETRGKRERDKGGCGAGLQVRTGDARPGKGGRALGAGQLPGGPLATYDKEDQGAGDGHGSGQGHRVRCHGAGHRGGEGRRIKK